MKTESNLKFYGIMSFKYIVKIHEIRDLLRKCTDTFLAEKYKILMSMYLENLCFWTIKAQQDVLEFGRDENTFRELTNIVFSQYYPKSNN